MQSRKHGGWQRFLLPGQAAKGPEARDAHSSVKQQSLKLLETLHIAAAGSRTRRLTEALSRPNACVKLRVYPRPVKI